MQSEEKKGKWQGHTGGVIEKIRFGYASPGVRNYIR
jgi:hypothetical protein